jgi:hypothetical protein
MIELILGYYQGEKNTALIALGIGILFLLLTAFLFFAHYKTDQLVKGLVWAFLVAGLFWTLAGVGATNYAGKKIADTQQLSHNETDLRASEVERMEKVFTTGVAYKVAMIMFSGLIVIGLIIILINPSNLILKGVALGMLIFGTVGHTTEVFSMRKNQSYYNNVLNYEVENIK